MLINLLKSKLHRVNITNVHHDYDSADDYHNCDHALNRCGHAEYHHHRHRLRSEIESEVPGKREEDTADTGEH